MNTEHKGKTPGQRIEVDVEKETRKNIKDKLKKELNAAVATENFEQAAKLRDEIALLDKEGE
jgi:protein-arginine kinase activator protein McsA